MLFFGLQELELRKVHFSEDLPVGEIDFDNQIRQISPLHAEGEAELLNNTLGEIRVRGKLSVEVEMECDRCLDPVRHSIVEQFDLFYRPAPAKGEVPHELAISDGESEIGFYEGSGIELNDILREHILLSLPMHSICRDECAGICPQCGQNRNAGTCGCTTKPADDRWEALRELRGQLRSN